MERKETVRKVLQNRFADFANIFNQYIEEVNIAIRKKGVGQEVLFIVDGLEKTWWWNTIPETTSGRTRSWNSRSSILSYFERALQVREGIGDRQGEGVTLNNISLIYREKGDFTSALTVLQKSLSIQQEIGDRHGVAVTLHNIGTVFYEQEHFTDAVTYFFQAYQVFDEIGSPNAQTSMQYLQSISERIGEEMVKAIIGQLTQSETN